MKQSDQRNCDSDDSSPLLNPNQFNQPDALTELQQFVKDNVLDEKIKRDLNPQQLRNFDLQNLLSKSILSDENKLVIRRAVDFVMEKQQSAFVRYFETLLERAEEFTDEYYHPQRQALASGKVKPEKTTPEDFQRRFHEKYGGAKRELNFELDLEKLTIKQK